MHFESGVGHIGGNLSALDAILLLHHRVMQPSDFFILSKGHAAGALYVALWSLGKLSDEDLMTFHKDGTRLAGHPVAGWSSDIPFATGSLGHGLPAAAGIALGLKLRRKPGRVFCLMSDGEWEEGSNWEALIFAAHHQLRNLTILVDQNGLQGFGSTREVASMDLLADRLAGFPLELHSLDGHDCDAMEASLRKPASGLQLILLQTIKGHGVSFMENVMDWHYLPLNEHQYRRALDEVS
jgi:transketolase